MPENEKKLILHSPAGSEHVAYKWPLHRSDNWNEATEIVETIRWVCQDFPELKLAVENHVLNEFDPASYDSMRLLCEKYNRAVDNLRKLWSGRQPPSCINSPPCMALLRHIMNQIYSRAVTNPDELNSYEPFSPEVYGETSFELVEEIVKQTELTEADVFLDLGSGVGQVVLQVAAFVGCKCYGIEKAEIPYKYAERMQVEFHKWMAWYGKSYGEYEIIKGDFLLEAFDSIISQATVIFTNNFAFGPGLNHQLKLKFQNLRDGTKIVSSLEFCPLNFRITHRNLSDIGAMMNVVELSPLKGSVSWTPKPVSYYLHVIDRGKLEDYFHKQKHPEDNRSEESSSGTLSPCGEHVGKPRVNHRLLPRTKPKANNGTKNVSAKLAKKSKTLLEAAKRTQHNKKQRELHLKGLPITSPQRDLHLKGLPITSPQRDLHLKGLPITSPQRDLHLKGLPITSPQRDLHLKGLPITSSPHQRAHLKGLPITSPPHQRPAYLPAVPAFAPGPRPLVVTPFEPLLSSFRDQLQAYLNQMKTAEYSVWLAKAIEKECMKQKHLQTVIAHLESDVASLSRSTVERMEESMEKLGIKKLDPEGLLQGAKHIVTQNKQLRKELIEIERDVNNLKSENDCLTSFCEQQNLNLNASLVDNVTTSQPSLPPPFTATPTSKPEDPGPAGPQAHTDNQAELAVNKQLTDHGVSLPDGKPLVVEKDVKASLECPDLNCMASEYEVRLERVDLQSNLEPVASSSSSSSSSSSAGAGHTAWEQSYPPSGPVVSESWKSQKWRPVGPIVGGNEEVEGDGGRSPLVQSVAPSTLTKKKKGSRKQKTNGSKTPLWDISTVDGASVGGPVASTVIPATSECEMTSLLQQGSPAPSTEGSVQENVRSSSQSVSSLPNFTLGDGYGSQSMSSLSQTSSALQSCVPADNPLKASQLLHSTNAQPVSVATDVAVVVSPEVDADRAVSVSHCLMLPTVPLYAMEPQRHSVETEDCSGPSPVESHDQRGPSPMESHDQRGPSPMESHDQHGPSPVESHDQHGPSPVESHDQQQHPLQGFDPRSSLLCTPDHAAVLERYSLPTGASFPGGRSSEGFSIDQLRVSDFFPMRGMHSPQQLLASAFSLGKLYPNYAGSVSQYGSELGSDCTAQGGFSPQGESPVLHGHSDASSDQSPSSPTTQDSRLPLPAATQPTENKQQETTGAYGGWPGQFPVDIGLLQRYSYPFYLPPWMQPRGGGAIFPGYQGPVLPNLDIASAAAASYRGQFYLPFSTLHTPQKQPCAPSPPIMQQPLTPTSVPAFPYSKSTPVTNLWSLNDTTVTSWSSASPCLAAGEASEKAALTMSWVGQPGPSYPSLPFYRSPYLSVVGNGGAVQQQQLSGGYGPRLQGVQGGIPGGHVNPFQGGHGTQGSPLQGGHGSQGSPHQDVYGTFQGGHSSLQGSQGTTDSQGSPQGATPQGGYKVTDDRTPCSEDKKYQKRSPVDLPHHNGGGTRPAESGTLGRRQSLPGSPGVKQQKQRSYEGVSPSHVVSLVTASTPSPSVATTSSPKVAAFSSPVVTHTSAALVALPPFLVGAPSTVITENNTTASLLSTLTSASASARPNLALFPASSTQGMDADLSLASTGCADSSTRLPSVSQPFPTHQGKARPVKRRRQQRTHPSRQQKHGLSATDSVEVTPSGVPLSGPPLTHPYSQQLPSFQVLPEVNTSTSVHVQVSSHESPMDTYGLAILAACSTLQSENKTSPQRGGGGAEPAVGPGLEETSTLQRFCGPPVLGSGVGLAEGHGPVATRSQQLVEQHAAVDTLLQLSVAMQKAAASEASAKIPSVAVGVRKNSRSASYSAAEAILMIAHGEEPSGIVEETGVTTGTSDGAEEVFEQHREEGVVSKSQSAPWDLSCVGAWCSRARMDRESVDSESTLTPPGSPDWREHPPHSSVHFVPVRGGDRIEASRPTRLVDGAVGQASASASPEGEKRVERGVPAEPVSTTCTDAGEGEDEGPDQLGLLHYPQPRRRWQPTATRELYGPMGKGLHRASLTKDPQESSPGGSAVEMSQEYRLERQPLRRTVHPSAPQVTPSPPPSPTQSAQSPWTERRGTPTAGSYQPVHTASSSPEDELGPSSTTVRRGSAGQPKCLPAQSTSWREPVNGQDPISGLDSTLLPPWALTRPISGAVSEVDCFTHGSHVENRDIGMADSRGEEVWGECGSASMQRLPNCSLPSVQQMLMTEAGEYPSLGHLAPQSSMRRLISSITATTPSEQVTSSAEAAAPLALSSSMLPSNCSGEADALCPASTTGTSLRGPSDQQQHKECPSPSTGQQQHELDTTTTSSCAFPTSSVAQVSSTFSSQASSQASSTAWSKGSLPGQDCQISSSVENSLEGSGGVGSFHHDLPVGKRCSQSKQSAVRSNGKRQLACHPTDTACTTTAGNERVVNADTSSDEMRHRKSSPVPSTHPSSGVHSQVQRTVDLQGSRQEGGQPSSSGHHLPLARSSCHSNSHLRSPVHDSQGLPMPGDDSASSNNAIPVGNGLCLAEPPQGQPCTPVDSFPVPHRNPGLLKKSPNKPPRRKQRWDQPGPGHVEMASSTKVASVPETAQQSTHHNAGNGLTRSGSVSEADKSILDLTASPARSSPVAQVKPTPNHRDPELPDWTQWSRSYGEKRRLLEEEEADENEHCGAAVTARKHRKLNGGDDSLARREAQVTNGSGGSRFSGKK